MQKALDSKLANILSDPSCGDFILADAKDADMAGGMAAPGKGPEHHGHDRKFRSLEQYRFDHLKNSREIFLHLVEKVRDYDRDREQQLIAARDYESLELYVMRLNSRERRAGFG